MSREPALHLPHSGLPGVPGGNLSSAPRIDSGGKGARGPLAPWPGAHEVLERAMVGYYQSTPDGRFLYVNDAFARLLGYSAATDVINSVHDIAGQLYVDATQRALFKETLDRNGTARNLEFAALRRDGSPIRLVFDARVVRDAEGAPMFYEGFIRQSAPPRVLGVDPRPEADEALRALLAPVSHELGDSLRGLASFLRLLDRSVNPAASAEYTRYAMQSVVRAQGLVESFRWLLRMDQEPERRDTIDLGAVVDAVGWALNKEMQAAGGLLVRDTLPTVLGDEGHLLWAVRNLIDNSLRFRGSAPPRIEVWAEKCEKEWFVHFRDNGIGFPTYAIGDTFYPCRKFHEGERTGAGMGLYVVSRIMARHGGRLWTVRRHGEGAEVVLAFPSETASLEKVPLEKLPAPAPAR